MAIELREFDSPFKPDKRVQQRIIDIYKALKAAGISGFDADTIMAIAILHGATLVKQHKKTLGLIQEAVEYGSASFGNYIANDDD